MCMHLHTHICTKLMTNIFQRMKQTNRKYSLWVVFEFELRCYEPAEDLVVLCFPVALGLLNPFLPQTKLGIRIEHAQYHHLIQFFKIVVIWRAWIGLQAEMRYPATLRASTLNCLLHLFQLLSFFSSLSFLRLNGLFSFKWWSFNFSYKKDTVGLGWH